MSTSDTRRILAYMETQSRTLISKAAAAELAGVNIRTIKRWAVAGRIAEKRDPQTGRTWYVGEEIEAVRNGQR